MFVLDTDTFTHLLRGQERVSMRRSQVTEEVAVTVVTRIEVLQGRFAALLKAADPDQLQRAQSRLAESERQLASFAVLPVDAAAAAEFGRLLDTKGLRRIGRGDLLIAAITLAKRATLVSRNLKDFRLVPGLQIENWAD
jgi:tRNA(fMet)-specific endonuclease VapC